MAWHGMHTFVWQRGRLGSFPALRAGESGTSIVNVSCLIQAERPPFVFRARHGMAWHGMAWHSIAWLGIAWHGMAWHGIA